MDGPATVVPLVDEGLGNSAYLVDLGDGRALAVDVSRDVRSALRTAHERNLRIAYAADTHLHADFITGVRDLAAVFGDVRILASAEARLEYAHTALHDGEVVDLGGLSLQALATPGHTPEHLSLTLHDGSRILGVFTGGALIVGSVARTDLIAREQTDALSRALYRSLQQRLLTLPDDTAVWPTHGAGSFCSAPPGTERTSTIGRERATNPLLAAPDEDSFVERLIAGLGSYPDYFLRLREVNRRGPRVDAGDPVLTPLSVDEVRRLAAKGAEIIDARPVTDFVAGHIPGALSIALRPAFASWLGWLVSEQRPLVVVLDPDQDGADLAWQCRKVGYDRIAGVLNGGMDAWRAASMPVRVMGTTDAAHLADPLLDVRQQSEFDAGHLPHALHVELGSLDQRLDDIPHHALTVMCGHGERAATAASLLERAGWHDVRVVVGGGAEEWAKANGQALTHGR
jgi:glyoxylase-like metal-dependent hydrolase (beta-lactamase superfamily II)